MKDKIAKISNLKFNVKIAKIGKLNSKRQELDRKHKELDKKLKLVNKLIKRLHSNRIKLKGGEKMESEKIDYLNNEVTDELKDLEFTTEVITEKDQRNSGRTCGYNQAVIGKFSLKILEGLKEMPINEKLVLNAPLMQLWTAIRVQNSEKTPKNWKSHLKNELLLKINELGYPIVKEKTASMQKGIKINFNNDTDRLEIRKVDFNFED
jgi:hypothetical protein